jgi:hypothetical protein
LISVVKATPDSSPKVSPEGQLEGGSGAMHSGEEAAETYALNPFRIRLQYALKQSVLGSER